MMLRDLVGEHELSGVDTITEKDEQFNSCYNVVRFVLDGKTYSATEDPDGGYMSFLKDIETTCETVANNFPPQKVIGKMKYDDDEFEPGGLIQFIDAVTGKVVLEIGTDDKDFYYPYCVLAWSPENLAINQGGGETNEQN